MKRYALLLCVAVLSGCATPPAGDTLKGLTTPMPPRAAVKEGFADLGNTKLWYWDTGGPGEVVVFLHPGSGSAEFYPFQQAVFAKAGYRAISYSRRGQNGSEPGKDAATYFAADDLLALMDHLKVAKFHLVGNALGGYVGLDLALSRPDRVQSLVLACSMMGIAEPDFARTLQSLRPKAFEELPLEVKELGPSYRAANPEGVAEWKRRNERSGTRGPVRLRNRFTWETLAGLKVPTLLMTGDADLWIPPWLLYQVAPKFPNGKVVVVPNAGHGVQWEQPALFNDAVLQFVRANPAN